MALEYTLELATQLPSAAVSDLLINAECGFVSQSGRLTAPGVDASASPETELSRQIVRDAYQIEPYVYVTFRVDKFEDWATGVETTIRCTLAILDRLRCDGVLLFNGETVILLQRSGKLLLNRRHDFWEDRSRLALVGEPYEMQEIASL